MVGWVDLLLALEMVKASRAEGILDVVRRQLNTQRDGDDEGDPYKLLCESPQSKVFLIGVSEKPQAPH
jgi:hypothetical protein